MTQEPVDTANVFVDRTNMDCTYKRTKRFTFVLFLCNTSRVCHMTQEPVDTASVSVDRRDMDFTYKRTERLMYVRFKELNVSHLPERFTFVTF